MQPLVVRAARAASFDLISSSSTIAALDGVHQEHPAGLQAALGHDLVRRHVQHAGLAGQHHAVVGGLPPAGRAQAVAVEHRADQRAVGERHARRAVPRLHQAGVELVERAALRVHRGVVLPRLRDHHQHRVRQAAAAEVQQLQHLVEATPSPSRPGRRSGTAGSGRPGSGRTSQQRLAGPHAVAVAADRVDLAVVRDEPERVRQRPRRERVRGEPAVHQGDRARQPLVGAGRGRTTGSWRWSAFPCRRSCGRTATGSTRPRPPPRSRARPACAGRRSSRSSSTPPRHRSSARATNSIAKCGITDRAVGPTLARLRGDRHVTPAEDLQALLVGDRARPARRPWPAARRPAGRKAMPAAYAPRLRQLEVDHRAQELVRQLQQDSGTVAAGRLGARGAAVLEVGQCGQRVDRRCRANAGPGCRRPSPHHTRHVRWRGRRDPARLGMAEKITA